MKCPNCGADAKDTERFCFKCGKELPKLSEEIDVEIIYDTMSTVLTGESVAYKEKIQTNPEFANIEKMKCPKCHSEDIQYVHETQKRGFSASDSCCGYMLLGPIGLLCGAFGMNNTSYDEEFWVCKGCGSKFGSADYTNEADKLKGNAQTLFSVNDDTIDKVDELISKNGGELIRMRSRKEQIESLINETRNAEYSSNKKLNYVRIGMVVAVILIVIGTLVAQINSDSEGMLFFIVLFAIPVGAYILWSLFLEKKFASNSFNKRMDILNELKQKQDEQIHISENVKTRLEKIKEAKSQLKLKNII